MDTGRMVRSTELVYTHMKDNSKNTVDMPKALDSNGLSRHNMMKKLSHLTLM